MWLLASTTTATFWVELITHAGVLGVIAVFLIRNMAERDKRQAADHVKMINKILDDSTGRENRMATRIDKLEEDNVELSKRVQEKLVELVEQATRSHTENTTVMRELAGLAKEQYLELKALREVLTLRPCFSQEVREHILEKLELELQAMIRKSDE